MVKLMLIIGIIWSTIGLPIMFIREGARLNRGYIPSKRPYSEFIIDWIIAGPIAIILLLLFAFIPFWIAMIISWFIGLFVDEKPDSLWNYLKF